MATNHDTLCYGLILRRKTLRVMTENIGSLTSALAYKAAAPLRSEIERTEEELDVSISWIRFDGIRRRRVTAILVEPVGDGPFAGLIFLHPFSGDKMFFLGEAKQLAAGGIASLLIEAPHQRLPPHGLTADLRDPKSVRSYYLQTIGDIRRGYDLLKQLDTIDPEYFGYVGRNEGAGLAPAISALEPRVTTIVSIAGIPRQSVYWVRSNSPEALELRNELGPMALKQYTRGLAEFDAAPLLRHARADNWLFQFATDDDRVPEEEIELLRSQLAKTAEVRFYDEHGLDSAAEIDRGRWLESKLLPR